MSARLLPAASAVASATTTAAPPPGNLPPSGVTALPGSGQMTIAWIGVSGATSYNVYWSTSAGVSPSSGTRISNATNPQVITGLTNGKAY